jgi:hypothetical protein
MRNMRGAISMRELYAVGLLLACLILLLSHHSASLVRLANQAGMTDPAAEPVTEPDATPASLVASVEARRAFKAARQLRLEHDLGLMQPLLEKWSLLTDGNSPGNDRRIADMQDIRQQLDGLVLSSQCAVDAQQANGDAMDASITYFIARSRHWTNAPQELEQATRKAEAAKQVSTACSA